MKSRIANSTHRKHTRFLLLLLIPTLLSQPVLRLSGLDATQYTAQRALTLFEEGQDMELRGSLSAAVERYEGIVRTYPDEPVAAEAQFRIATLYKTNKEYVTAFKAYEKVIEDFPASSRFVQAIEGEFEIVEEVLSRISHKTRYKDRSPNIELPKMEVIRDMLRVILTQARFGDFAAKAKYLTGTTFQRTGDMELAIEAFSRVAEQHPEHLLASHATFQIAFIHYLTGVEPGVHLGNLAKARTSFEDFILRFAGSEKVPEAKYILRRVELLELKYLMTALRFYEKQGKPEAVKIYKAELLKITENPRKKPTVREIEEERLPRELLPPEEEPPSAGDEPAP